MFRQSKPGIRINRGQSKLSVSRRQILKGVLGAGMAWQIPQVRAMTLKPSGPGRHQAAPRRAIYQDMPYVDFSGFGQGYTPPRGNAATRQYLATLNDQQRQTLLYFS